MMELMMVVAGLIGLALAGSVAGADSRPRFDEEPHREI
jgi:hypothetical protein